MQVFALLHWIRTAAPKDFEQMSEQIDSYAELFVEQGYQLKEANDASLTMKQSV